MKKRRMEGHPCSTPFSTIFQSIVLFLNTWFFQSIGCIFSHVPVHGDRNYTPTLPEHPSSSPVFSGVRVARSFVFCLMFGRWSFVPLSFVFWPLWCLLLHFTASDCPFGIFRLFLCLCSFSFGHCIVCPSLYGFRLPLWYLQAFLLS